MAHLRLKSQAQSQPAIFSPSVARAAASTAKDWAYVDRWLRDKFGSRAQIPAIERNPETLKALLALAAANEAADEERETLSSIEETALQEARQADAAQTRQRKQNAQRQQQQHGAQATSTPDGASLAEELLNAIDASLSDRGQAALDALSETAVSLDDPAPTSSSLAARFTALQTEAASVSATASRVDLLHAYLARQSAQLSALLAEIRDPALPYAAVSTSSSSDPSATQEVAAAAAAAADLATSNAAQSQHNQSLSAVLPKLHSHVTELSQLVRGLPPTLVSDVLADEESYRDLLSAKKSLDAQVKAFAGLPPDVDAARAELEFLRDQLAEVTDRRDGDFERLVERESPVKSRKGGRS